MCRLAAGGVPRGRRVAGARGARLQGNRGDRGDTDRHRDVAPVARPRPVATARGRYAAEEIVLSCARLHQMLDAYIDGELDAATAAELDQHLAACAACAALRAEREALSARIRAAVPYYPAPGRLRSGLDRPLRRVDPRPQGPSWPLAGALAAAAAVAGLVAGVWLGRG